MSIDPQRTEPVANGRAAPSPQRTVVMAGALLGVCILLAVSLRSVLVRVGELYPAELPASPYFIAEHFGLLYLALPLAVLALLLVILAPGLLLVLASGKAASVEELVLKGFGVSFVVHFVALSLVKVACAAADTLATPGVFMVSMIGTAAGCFGILCIQHSRGKLRTVAWPRGLRRALSLAAVPVVATWGFLPIVFWQDFNPDGLEALSMGRSLFEYLLPMLPTGDVAGLSVGMNSNAYPVNWFVAWIGPVEAAARLPALLYAPVIFAGLLLLCEWRMPRSLKGIEEATLALALATFYVALAYNNSYHPYFADLASPATIDFLTVACLIGVIFATWKQEWGWLLLFAVIVNFNRPTGLLFLVLLFGAVALLWREDRVRTLFILALAGVSCFALTLAHEYLYVPLQGLELWNAGAKLGWRLRYYTFTDVGRFLYLVVPTGLIPVAAMCLLRGQDRYTRSLTLVIIAYFGFFYVRAFIALHHFAPAMILPVVVLWRILLQQRHRPLVVSVAATFVILSLWLSLPRSFVIDRTFRGIGQATDYRAGDYSGSYQGYREAFRHKDLLNAVFRDYLQVEDPSRELIGSAWVHVHYAAREKHGERPINYLVAPLEAPGPPGRAPLESDDEFAVYVIDAKRWIPDRYQPLVTDYQSRIYAISRETLLPFFGVPAGNYSVDLRALLSGG